MTTISILAGLISKKATIIFSKLDEQLDNCTIMEVDKSIMKVCYNDGSREKIKVIPIRNIRSIITEREK